MAVSGVCAGVLEENCGKVRGQKLNPNIFFSNFSGAFGGISRQNPGISRQKSLIPWVSRDIPNFLAPTPSRGRPPPHQKISGLKSLGLGSFSAPEFKSRENCWKNFPPNREMLQILRFRAPGKANLPGTLGRHCRDLVSTFRAGCFLKSTVPAVGFFLFANFLFFLFAKNSCEKRILRPELLAQPAPLQKCAGDFCCVNFGGFCRGLSWRIFLGTISHQNEKKSGDKIREKIRKPKKSVLPKANLKNWVLL